MTDSPEAYLRRCGVRYRRVGADEVRFPCPQCHQDEGLSFNLVTGLWVCERASCGARGNLYQLKVLRGDALEVSPPSSNVGGPPGPLDLPAPPPPLDEVTAWQAALWNDPAAAEARAYVRGRGLSDELLKWARIGWSPTRPKTVANKGSTKRETATPRSVGVVTRASLSGASTSRVDPPATPLPAVARPQEGNGWLTIPYFSAGTSDPDLVKLRAVPPEPVDKSGKVRRYERIAGGTTTLYAPCGLSTDEPVLVTGGEFDLLALVQVARTAGYETLNICSPGGERSWQEEWSVMLEAAKDIVLLYDNDPAGRKGAEWVAGILGRHRCRLASWPEGCKDANNALTDHELEWFGLQAIITDAKSPASSQVVKPSELAEEVVVRLFGSAKGAAGRSTGWRSVDELIGGWRDHEITLLSGETGSGKTTFAGQAVGFQLDLGHRGLLWPAEIGPVNQLRKLVSQLSGQPLTTMSADEIRSQLRSLDNLCWLVRKRGRVEPHVFRETLLYACSRLGVSFVMLDHIDHLAGLGQDQWTRRSALVEALLEVAAEVPAHFLVIAHPEKSRGGNRMVMPWDIKGTSDLIQAADNGMSIFRPRSPDEMKEATGQGSAFRGPEAASVLVWKRRENVGTGEGIAHLKFDPNTERYL